MPTLSLITHKGGPESLRFGVGSILNHDPFKSGPKNSIGRENFYTKLGQHHLQSTIEGKIMLEASCESNLIEGSLTGPSMSRMNQDAKNFDRIS